MSSPVLQSFFSKDSFQALHYPSESSLSDSTGDLAVALLEFIGGLRLELGFHQLLKVVKAGDALESM